MASLSLWVLLCLFSCVIKTQSTDMAEVLAQIKALTTQYSDQRTELVSRFEEVTNEIIQEVSVMINESKSESISARHDVARLQKLLDTDECLELTHNCSTDARCLDTRTSFRCECKDGLTGDGYTCEDIDECAGNETICGENAICSNKLGGYDCNCEAGFMVGDLGYCEDIDECSKDNHGCDKYAICENTIGGYNCTCSMFHEGDGRKCTETDVQCKDPFEPIAGVGCIHQTTRSQEFDESRESCKELGGDLFVALNKDHYLRLAEHFKSTGQASKNKYLWVGVKEGAWLDGRTVDPEEEAPGNPSMGSGKCSYTDGDTSEKFLLWTDPCYYDWKALCQQTNSPFPRH